MRKTSFLKNAELDLLVGHTATGATAATLKTYLEYDKIFCSAFSFQRKFVEISAALPYSKYV